MDVISFVDLKCELNKTAVGFRYPEQWGPVVTQTVENPHNAELWGSQRGDTAVLSWVKLIWPD